MIKAIIFDLFGVLITDGFGTVLNEVRQEDANKALSISEVVEKANRGEISTDVLRSTNAKTLGLTVDEYVYKIRSNETINQVLLDYIKELHKNYKIGLLSNVGKGGIAQRLSKEILDEHFDVVVASSDIGFAKPQAQAFEITADRLGVRYNQCIMIDDKVDYCVGANGVGMESIQYKNFEQFKKELAKFL
jgi:HAD superfamily hydrolase (TIGR01509 family)